MNPIGKNRYKKLFGETGAILYAFGERGTNLYLFGKRGTQLQFVGKRGTNTEYCTRYETVYSIGRYNNALFNKKWCQGGM